MNSGSIKKICMYGTGGVGGYFGGLIADAISSEKGSDREVYFIARGKHLEEIQKNGLTLNSKRGQNLNVRPSLATDRFESIPAPDLIILTVKGYDLDDALADISKNIKDDTIIIPLLNGIDIHDRIRKIIKRGIVLHACVYIVSSIEKPGTVTQKGDSDLIVIGKDQGHPEFDPQWLLSFFDSAKLNYQWMENSLPAIWEKYMLIAPFALTTARYAKPFGGIMEDEKLKEKTKNVMEEIVAISKKMNIAMKDTVIQDTFTKVSKLPYESTTSFQRDYAIKTKKNELDLFGGTIIRLGKECGIETPATLELNDYLVNNR